jgi:hypothetical protein
MVKFRVNKVLYPYFKKEYVTKSFCNYSIKDINIERTRICNAYIEILQLAKNSQIEKTHISLLVNKFNTEILNQRYQTKLIEEKLTILMAYNKFKVYYDSLNIKNYVQKRSISKILNH